MRDFQCFQKKGFSLLELLIALVLVSLLSTLGLLGYRGLMGSATRAHCTSNLRQLCAAVTLYCADHNGFFPPYVTHGKNGQRTWYFGHESSRPGTAEGKRNLDVEAGPLYPYIQAVGSVEICRGFNYDKAQWKPKFKGASYGYGYNWWLGGRSSGKELMNITTLRNASQVMLFGDCAQANTFQGAANGSNPLLEEFYIIDEKEVTVHFRHSRTANILFVDGHVESFQAYPGTEQELIPGELLGRISPSGSMEYLK